MSARPPAPVPGSLLGVLAKVGEDSNYELLELGTTDVGQLTFSRLVKALQLDENFSILLAGVLPSGCDVFVCASTSPAEPSPDELRCETQLKGAVTLRTLATQLAGQRDVYLYVRVIPPQLSAPPAVERMQSRHTSSGERVVWRISPILPPYGGYNPSILTAPTPPPTHPSDPPADILLRRLKALTIDHRPSDLSKPSSWEKAIRPRNDDDPGHVLATAPEWVTACVMAGLPERHLPPLPLSALDPAFGMVAEAATAPAIDPAPHSHDQALAIRALEIMRVSSELHASERERTEALLVALRATLGIDVVKAEADDRLHGTVTDGSCFVVTPAGSRVLVLNLEVNENTASGRPEMQNITYYSQHYFPRGSFEASRTSGVGRDVLNALPLVPALLLEVHGGASIAVRGVAMAGSCVLSEVLASAHLLGRPGSPQHWALVHLLAGLRRALRSLLSRYATATPTNPLGLEPRELPPDYGTPGALLPSSVPATAPDGGRALLHLQATGDALLPHRWVFRGRCALQQQLEPAAVGAGAPPPHAPPQGLEWRPCVLKLAATYGEAAHRHAAALGVAPELFAVARLPGGWVIIAMESLAPEDGWERYDATRRDHTDAARAAAGALHHAGFVHGDLRAANVLVRPAARAAGRRSSGSTGGAAGPLEVRLLDWDWAGRAGEALYPTLRHPARRWAPGSEAGGAILPQHDLDVLSCPEDEEG